MFLQIKSNVLTYLKIGGYMSEHETKVQANHNEIEEACMKNYEDLTERELRIQLAASYRLVEELGWSFLIFGHLTARVPGPEKHFLINPYGLMYDEVTASNLEAVTSSYIKP